MAAGLLGVRRPRFDARDKVTGATVFTADVALANPLCGVVLRSPHPFARIKRLDVSRAARMPGVAAVVSAHNTPQKPLAFGIKDQLLFPKTYVRYRGEPVAALAAGNEQLARAALDAIEIEYEVLTPVTTIEQALAPGARLVHPDWRAYEKAEGRTLRGNVCGYNRIKRGDVEAQFARPAATVVESEFRFSAGMPGYLEPRCAAAWRKADGSLTVWCGSQSPYGNRAELAAYFDLAESKVRFINQFVGGGFGGKILMAAEWYAAALALHCDRPVRVAWSRYEDCLHVFPRHGGRAKFKSAAAQDGTLLALRASFVFDTGAYIGYGAGTGLIATMLASAPYRIPNLDIDSTLVYTNKQIAGPVRAPGGPQANFAKESHLDELAAALCMDPLELRLKNIWREGDFSPTGQRLSAVSAEQTLREAAKAIDWHGPRKPGQGRGLCCTWWFSSCSESQARVSIGPGGKVRISSGNPEVGTGSASDALRILAADVLRIDPADAEIVLGDTDTDTYDSGVGGSGSTYSAGQAVEAAARHAREQLLQKAEDVLEARADDLELRSGAVAVRGAPDHHVSFEQLAEQNGGVIEGEGAAPEIGDPEFDAALVQTHDFASWHAPSFTTTAAQVEVDAETGQVCVRKLATAQDVGFAVNPAGVSGQIEGGAVQGLGFALTEELHFDDGALQNPDFKNYLLPTAVDAPEIEAIIVETPSPDSPRGMKGAGEPPVTTPAGAIANAIRAAAGAAPHETPMTPERVWLALQRKSGPR